MGCWNGNRAETRRLDFAVTTRPIQVQGASWPSTPEPNPSINSPVCPPAILLINYHDGRATGGSFAVTRDADRE